VSVAVPLDVVLVVVLEHVPDVVRIAQQVVPLRAKRYAHHVATLSRSLYQGGERLPLELRQVADEREALETGDLVIRLGIRSCVLQDPLLKLLLPRTSTVHWDTSTRCCLT
jgi:hypothetical protein